MCLLIVHINVHIKKSIRHLLQFWDMEGRGRVGDSYANKQINKAKI